MAKGDLIKQTGLEPVFFWLAGFPRHLLTAPLDMALFVIFAMNCGYPLGERGTTFTIFTSGPLFCKSVCLTPFPNLLFPGNGSLFCCQRKSSIYFMENTQKQKWFFSKSFAVKTISLSMSFILKKCLLSSFSWPELHKEPFFIQCPRRPGLITSLPREARVSKT